MRLFLVSLLVLFFSDVDAQWETLEVPFNDNLEKVFASDGMVIALSNDHLYKSDSGGENDDWFEFSVFDNVDVEQSFNNSNFVNAVISEDSDLIVIAHNTEENVPVIFYISLVSNTVSQVYSGVAGDRLNDIALAFNELSWVAAGDNGLLVAGNPFEVAVLTPEIVDDFITIRFTSGTNQCWATGPNAKYQLYSVSSGQDEEINMNYYYSDISFTETSGGTFITEDQYGTFTMDFNSVTTRYDRPREFHAVMSLGSTVFLGTDRGILRGSSLNACYQPSSGLEEIHDLTRDGSNQNLYACGLNGLLLKTSNNGGACIPWVGFNGGEVNAACLQQTYTCNYQSSDIDEVSWFLNGEFISDSDDPQSFSYDELASIEVVIQVTNSYELSYSDTITLNWVDWPSTVIQFETENTTLCFDGEIEVEILNPQTGYVYQLINDNTVYGQSEPGNGEPLAFNSFNLNSSIEFTLRAAHELGSCQSNIPDSEIEVTVEETQADFAVSLVNAEVNEACVFSSTSADASNFTWSFEFNGQIGYSEEDSPSFSFLSEGQPLIELTATSNSGCTSTVSKLGPNVFVMPDFEEDCFSTEVNSIDNTMNISRYATRGLAATDSFYVACGVSNKGIVGSRYGVNKDLGEQNSSFLAGYDFNGVLKWTCQIDHELDVFFDDNSDLFIDVEINNEAVYVLTKAGSGTFYDSFGNNFKNELDNASCQVMKLTHEGELLWLRNLSAYGASALALKPSGEVICTGKGSTFSIIETFLNDDEAETILQYSNCSLDSENSFVIEIASNGDINWAKGFEAETESSSLPMKIGSDDDGNVYIVFSESIAPVRVCDEGSEMILEEHETLGSNSTKVIIMKFDGSGNAIWISALDSQTNSGPHASGMDVSPSGDIYITGHFEWGLNHTLLDLYSYNTNGDFQTAQFLNYFVTKINSNGEMEWVRSSNVKKSRGQTATFYDDKILIGGMAKTTTAVGGLGKFESSNNQVMSASVGENDYFLIEYDTNGTVLRFINSGFNINPFFKSKLFDTRKLASEDEFVVIQTYYLLDGEIEPVYHFNHQIESMNFENDHNAFITKIDLNCADVTLGGWIIDLDGDGYDSSVDCIDIAEFVNPGAEEIPNNGLDEDCDGMDEIVSVFQAEGESILLYPNPTLDRVMYFESPDLVINFTVTDSRGRIVQSSQPNTRNGTITINNPGMYFIHIQTKKKSYIQKQIVH